MTAVAQPSGTVTLVFTDIEGSTRLLDELGLDAYRDALAEHRRIVREGCARHDGYEVDYEGDAFFYAFGSAQGAVSAISEAMSELDGGPIRIRVGIHTGEPALDPPKYVGIDVHRAARIMSAAHGGQVVLSPTTVTLLEPGSVALKELGQHRLKDLSTPIALHQLQLDGYPTDFPPLKTLYRSNLPVPATPFLGRETELRTVVERLTHPDTRLLTLTGPGGTGKTRLALQAAADAADHYPDGITWVSLAPLRDVALVVPAIAEALGIREQPGEDLASTLATTLSGRKALLVLDNAEHLLPKAAHDVADLLTACPTMRALVTSRERLRIGSESAWPVPPLSADDGGRLFVERARVRGIEIEADETVGRLCRRLDELPLAIELAAARTGVLSPTAILERLDGRLDVLSNRDHDVDERQRTLEATIAWSYDLLVAEEQRALRALAMFPGGCTLGAARCVAGTDLDVIESLLDKSLVRHRPDDAGGDRYWMLETIREYAHARLLEYASEADAVFERFYAWLGDVVGEIDEYWVDRDQLQWFGTLARERPNLLHALAACRARGRVDDALRLLLAAGDFVDSRGPYGVFLDLIDKCPTDDQSLRARALILRLRLLLRLGRFVDASAAARGAARVDDAAVESQILSHRAFAILQRGDDGTALSHATKALELARLVAAPRALGDALNVLGLALITTGDVDSGLDRLRESIVVWEEIGDLRNISVARGNEAVGLLAARRPVEACTLMREDLAFGQGLDDPYLIVTALANLAIALAAAGDIAGARSCLQEAVDYESEQFDELLEVEAPLVLALVSVQEGEPERAIALWSAGQKRGGEIGYSVGPELTPYLEDRLEPLRALEGFAAAWEEGTRLSPGEAIQLGLRPPDD
ncbi:MAG TPA: adenylate/guanylate cyclase domain-containing protein [Gaiella sp.]|uniref:ATP-binding protein n=1 Tax=Gaiella sp. TaxID=2663207 RepID=UPI002D7ECCEA|nr:adenylate/guanylate cyclase domain-containing protein [Gaiella sp.]HET9287366.1 adenylate/guanylate cyclase domain-containing protein [Gaiella sp.]